MQRIPKLNIVAVQLMERVQIAGVQCGKTAGEIVQVCSRNGSIKATAAQWCAPVRPFRYHPLLKMPVKSRRLAASMLLVTTVSPIDWVLQW